MILRRKSHHRARGRLAVATLALAAAASAAAAEPTEAQRQKAAPCAACHGVEGRSTTADVPSLAGQPKQFITTQLVMFREGNRKNEIMNAMAAPLSNADISDLGSYFAAQAAAPAGTALAAETAAAARALTEKLGCVTCHGAELKGQQHIPRLAGQQTAYLRAQLLGFKAGTRFDMDGNMTAAAQPLTPADVETLAGYLSSLR
ncbi:MAG TPA: c-type cytochrome [Caldimonas sp.]|nr:c-type cytochrome [Caldimonas sp.]